ncbi:D-2-hydroxyacid dehydrogenase [Bacillus solitudinis]|uniref:D-2-hydroxyacid dehydrogenase n=1 Tax=Bacillus solitudinis TaxID=2014074 RepID=UPI000C2501B2|nr:D-2-hydroxyacid dehydrogenase [Bacillus solitudinis]
MNKRKLFITHNIAEDLVHKIENIIPGWEVISGKDRMTWQQHGNEAEVIAGWTNTLTEPCLRDDSKLRWVQTWSAGVNSLPLESFHSRNIQVTSANGVHAYPISETIFALMLGLTRKIHAYVKNQQTKTWHHSDLKLEMHQKTIGIIGVGEIGKETAKIAKAFGMTILGVRHSGKTEEFVDEMHKPDQLASVLPRCDYVVVTLPLTKDTYHFFGTEQFNQMKPSAFFINIGRGEVVVERELIAALHSGQLAGAGLDVFETEPLDEASPLWGFENVIITPHTSGSTEYYDERVIENIFIPNLKQYINGESPTINVVDFTKGY